MPPTAAVTVTVFRVDVRLPSGPNATYSMSLVIARRRQGKVVRRVRTIGCVRAVSVVIYMRSDEEGKPATAGEGY